jgi:hypothetical protein
MDLYEISWYVQHFGRFKFLVSCKENKSPTGGQVQWAFEQWWKSFIKGATVLKGQHMRQQFEREFEHRRIEKVEVIEL